MPESLEINIQEQNKSLEFENYEGEKHKDELKNVLEEIDIQENDFSELEEILYYIDDKDKIGIKLNEKNIKINKQRLKEFITNSNGSLGQLEKDIVITQAQENLNNLKKNIDEKEDLNESQKYSNYIDRGIIDENLNLHFDKLKKLDVQELWFLWSNYLEGIEDGKEIRFYTIMGDKLLNSGPEGIQALIKSEKVDITRERVQELISYSIFDKENIVEDIWNIKGAEIMGQDGNAKGRIIDGDTKLQIAMENIIKSSKLSNEYNMSQSDLENLFDNILYDDRKSAVEGLTEKFKEKKYINGWGDFWSDVEENGFADSLDKSIESGGLGTDRLEQWQRDLIKKVGKVGPLIAGGFLGWKFLSGNGLGGAVKRLSILGGSLIFGDILMTGIKDDNEGLFDTIGGFMYGNDPEDPMSRTFEQSKEKESYGSEYFTWMIFKTFGEENYKDGMEHLIERDGDTVSLKMNELKKELEKRKNDCEYAKIALNLLNNNQFSETHEEKIENGLNKVFNGYYRSDDYAYSNDSNTEFDYSVLNSEESIPQMYYDQKKVNDIFYDHINQNN